ncbi:COX15/CtaA family protein [bacterium]|nr:COX15/CtaA family protein [bacterium]
MSRTADVALASPGAVAAPAARFARYAWAVLAVNLAVILLGAYVRASGSGAGCGAHWPLCNGEVLPRDPALQTLIELSHRLSSGIALLLVGGLLIGAWRRYPPRHVVRRGAAYAAAFMVSEAAIGAGLVLLRYVADDTRVARGWWVAGHLVNTFLLVAALALTAWWSSGGAPPRIRGRRGLAAGLVAAAAGVLVLGVSGAVTALGDTLFPVGSLAEGEAMTFSESAHLFVRLRIYHPLLALAVGTGVLAAALAAARATPADSVRRLGGAVALLWVAQLLLGALNVYLLAPIPIQIVHLLLSDLIWIALVLLIAATLASDDTPG